MAVVPISDPSGSDSVSPFFNWPFVSRSREILRRDAEGAYLDWCFWSVVTTDRAEENGAIGEFYAAWLVCRLEGLKPGAEWSAESVIANIAADQVLASECPRQREVIDAFWREFAHLVHRACQRKEDR